MTGSIKVKKNLIIYSYFAAVICLSGCFDIKREIKIFPNGSGYEKVNIIVESSVIDGLKMLASQDNTGWAQKELNLMSDNGLWQQEITNQLQRSGGISVKEVQVTPKSDGSKEIYIYYVFDEPSALIKTVKETTFDFSNQQNVVFSQLKFLDEGDQLSFKYILRSASRSYDDSAALSQFSSQIQSKRIYYSIEMPFEVMFSNSQSKSGNTLSWDFSLSDILYNQSEMTATMKRDAGLDLPYAEKVDKTVQTVSKSKNPLVRMVLYNANKEEVKNGTGIVLKDGLAVTNFKLMTLMEGQGYFSIRMSNDSLAGVDEMKETDYDQKTDLVFFRFNNIEPVKTLKLAQLADVKVTGDAKIMYYPNTLSSVVYSMDAKITSIKSWGKKRKIIEIKPTKPLNIEGGAVFDEKGDLIGMITVAYEGEVGKLYVVPSDYIRERLFITR